MLRSRPNTSKHDDHTSNNGTLPQSSRLQNNDNTTPSHKQFRHTLQDVKSRVQNTLLILLAIIYNRKVKSVMSNALLLLFVIGCIAATRSVLRNIFPSSSSSLSTTTGIDFQDIPCESPSVPQGTIHMVVGGWKRHEKDPGISFSPHREHNYMWDIGLTNADIFWYRRVKPSMPLSPTLNGPCGMRMHERLLLPNHGREASAFLNHIVEVYDSPPTVLIFFHGHITYAWHTSCAATMARTTYYYRDLARGDDGTGYYPAKMPTGHMPPSRVKYHMMTLTSQVELENFKLHWFGGPLHADTGISGPNVTKWKFFEKWGDVIKERSAYQPHLDSAKGNPYRSCCANFIVPGERIRRFPKEFWVDLLAEMMDTSDDDYTKGQDLFEFVIYEYLGDMPEFPRSVVQKFYDDADRLFTARNGTNEVVIPDPAVLWRTKMCEQKRYKEYRRIRKVRNGLGRFGITDNPPEEVLSTWSWSSLFGTN